MDPTGCEKMILTYYLVELIKSLQKRPTLVGLFLGGFMSYFLIKFGENAEQRSQ